MMHRHAEVGTENLDVSNDVGLARARVAEAMEPHHGHPHTNADGFWDAGKSQRDGSNAMVVIRPGCWRPLYPDGGRELYDA